MSENKTKPTDVKVEDFLNAVEHPTRKKDGFELLKIMKGITKKKPVMWGPSIVGFVMKDNIILGDSRNLDTFQLPHLDFVITSPIFMRSDETKNPLSGFRENGTYQNYLDELQGIFRKMREFLKPGAKVIVEVFNLSATKTRPMTLLAWDIARAISGVLRFEKEIIACWQGTDRGDSPHIYGYNHSYCLVFDSE